MSISFVLVTFLLQLAIGMMLTVAILPSSLIDSRFFKSISFWSFLFAGFAIVLRRYSTFALPEIFFDKILVYFFGFLSLLFWVRLKFGGERPASKWEILLIALVGLTTLVVDSLPFRSHLGPLWVQNILIPINFLSSAMILGGFLAGMIFGHYYLVNTEMPKRLLVTMASILIGVLVFRLIAVGMTLLIYKEVLYPGAGFLGSLISFQGHGIFFWERVLVGLVIPAVVVAMIYSTAKIGSNQSATGIMYVAIAFVFIGELAARYLFLLSGIPL